jgi:hypothetical protein
MGADRLSLRAVLAALLVLSAALFAVGIVIERNAATTETHPGPVASASSEGGHSEPGEGSTSGEGITAGEGAEHQAASAAPEASLVSEPGESDAMILGVDLESPLFVGAAVLLSLGLAFAVLRTRNPVVPWAIAAFAVVFGLLDLREASHQLDEGRPGIATVAIILVAVHAAMALIAIRLAMVGERRVEPV